MQRTKPPEAFRWFTPDEVERARRYHRPLRRLSAASLAAAFGVLVAAAFTGEGHWLAARLAGLPAVGAALALAAILLACCELARLPGRAWRTLVHDRRYGLSTQTVRGFAADAGKGLAISAALGSCALAGLVALARALPDLWPAPAAAGAALLVTLLGFAAPVALEPLFNRFEPLRDLALAASLEDLARRAGVPVRQVLVADASRRSHALDAYVSGLGPTRRIVLFDTLVERTQPGELLVVVAHELAHARERHVLKGCAAVALGAAGAVAVLWGLLSSRAVLVAAGAAGAGDPRAVPFMLLTVAGLELSAAPAVAALSRRFERRADRLSLALTGSRDAYVALHRRLARANLADLDPPCLLHLLFGSHPTPQERLAAAA